MSLLKPIVRRALDGLDVGHKEVSGVSTYNRYATDVEKAPDWRVTLYGHRYPGHTVGKLKQNWNMDDPPKAIEVENYNSTRDRIVKYKYASTSPDQYKLAQWNYIREMLQDRFPWLSAAAITSFLAIFPPPIYGW